MATTSVTDSSFQADVLEATRPVLVDFWAEWCGPCKMIGPSLEELSVEFGERVNIVKLNIDENPEAPGKYGVRGIPTMILFNNGAPAATKVGAEPKSRLQAWLEGALAPLSSQADSQPAEGGEADRPDRVLPDGDDQVAGRHG